MNNLVNEESYVKINVWQDIFTMSKYTDSLDPTKEKLKRVINKYTLPTKGKCGLSNCGTAHNNGYIVETETGKLTNVGHICGKNHFGVSFQTLEKSFNREYRNRQAKENILKLISNSSQYLEKVDAIESVYGKISFIYKIQQFFTHVSKGCPLSVLMKLRSMSRNRNPTIYKTVELSKEEFDVIETSGAMNPSKYKEIPIDSLDGLAFIYNENNLRVYAEDFKNPLDEILSLDISSLSSSQLDRWSKKIGDFDKIIKQTHETMLNSKKFLQKENILKFKNFISNDDIELADLTKTLKDQFNIEV